MRNVLIKITNSINQFSQSCLKDMGKLFFLILFIALILFTAIEGQSFSASSEIINRSNYSMQQVATEIVENKDLNIELSDDLVKYTIKEDTDNYKIVLYGPKSNSVSLTCDKNFVIKNIHSTEYNWLFMFIIFYIYYEAVKFIFYIILKIIEIITKKIISINTIKDTNNN